MFGTFYQLQMNELSKIQVWFYRLIIKFEVYVQVEYFFLERFMRISTWNIKWLNLHWHPFEVCLKQNLLCVQNLETKIFTISLLVNCNHQNITEPCFDTCQIYLSAEDWFQILLKIYDSDERI